MILLDTSAWSAFSRGDLTVARRIEESDRIGMSAIVVGELMFGIHCGTRARQNSRILSDFLEDRDVEFLSVGYATADWFGRVSARQREIGRLVATNDLWIAAHTFEHGGELVTFDRDFSAIEGLRVEVLSAS